MYRRHNSGAISRLFSVVLITGLVSGCHRNKAGVTVPSKDAASPAVTSATPVFPPSATAAAPLWKRTLLASRTVPIQATVADIRFGADGRTRSILRFSVVEGVGQCYKTTVLEPANQKGNVVVSDGRRAWQYSPHAHTVTETPATTLASPSQWEEGVAGTVVQAEATLPELEPRSETIGGRKVRVLALRRQRSQHIAERRWIDEQTGRTVRLEQYGRKDARLLRRVEIADLKLLTPAEQTALVFRPDFPPDVRLTGVGGSVSQTQQKAAEKSARGVYLPLHVRGYALRSIDRSTAGEAVLATAPHPKSTGFVSAVKTTHLLYNRGDRAISVFATQTRQKESRKSAIVLQSGTNWKLVTLEAHLPGYVQDTPEGAAVAWADPKHGCYYIVIARLPLAELMPVAAAFAANRDDAPALETALSAREK